jgi:hypothetical protein
MPYPTVSAPYGFKPVNLLGGQVFAGSTRMLPIVYNYATNIFYGDFVNLSRGQVQRLSVTTAGATAWGGTVTAAAGTSYSTGAGALVAGTSGLVGVFLGCTYTSPVTKQKVFSQYWPANTLAGDAMAYISDDPDVALRAAVVTTQGGTTIGSVAPALVGQNLTASDLAGSTASGNSSNALLYTAITQTIAGEFTASAYPFRIVDVVRDTAVTLGTATYSSGTSTITTSANVAFAVPVGTQVAWLTNAGVLVDTGSFVTTAITANNTTSVVLSNAPLTTPSSNATLAFIQYPEAIVKFNMGAHGYYSSITVV